MFKFIKKIIFRISHLFKSFFNFFFRKKKPQPAIASTTVAVATQLGTTNILPANAVTPSSTVLNDNTPKKYSINLMWINKKLDPSKPYICGYESEDLLIEKVLDKARKWKKANPEAEVVFWYDGNCVTDKQLAATQAVLKKKSAENAEFAYKLKDIQEIDFVRQNADALSDNLPVYFRVDLLKLIICVNSILSNGMDAAIYSDLEVGDLRSDQGRMNKQELFNAEIMKRLETIGIQVNADCHKEENQFFQITNKPSTIQAIQTYINACLSRAITALNCRDESSRDLYFIPDLSMSVFSLMAAQLFPLIEMGAYNTETLVRADLYESEPKSEWVKYNIEEHGCLPLGNFYAANYGSSYNVPPGAEIKKENATTWRQLIKFSPLSLASPFSRKDMESRSGGDHTPERVRLVLRAPADGSDTYKCYPAVISASAAVIPASAAVIPASTAVVPASAAVVPAQAGIHPAVNIKPLR